MQRFAHPAVGLAKSHDFSRFLNHPRTTTSFWPDGAYLRQPDGIEKPSLFMPLEHHDQEVAPFERRLGFRLRLPKATASVRTADWRTYYSDADAGLVAMLCAEDIARSDCHFDGPA